MIIQKEKLTQTAPQTRISEQTKITLLEMTVALDREQQELVRMAIKMMTDLWKKGQWPEKGLRS